MGAFFPVPADPYFTSTGAFRVMGFPGTVGTPAPSPRDWAPSLTARPAGSVDTAQGSAVAPDVRFPTIYITRPVPQTLPHIIRNEMPIPATRIERLAKQAVQPPPRLGGRKVMRWPYAFQRWPILGGGTQ